MAGAVIIPAHNEESVLARTLEVLLDGLSEDVQVLVVPNGCHDRTADIARSFAPRVELVEVEEASKTAALNAGDGAARGFPRIYLDADIELPGAQLGRVLERLAKGDTPAAEPSVRLETKGASAVVRAYYAVWLALHGQQPGDVGCGLYGLSEQGRARFGAFPAVIADDGFVRAHFAPGEIAEVSGARSVVRVPRALSDLVKIKTRSRLGALQLARMFPELWSSKRSAHASIRTKVMGVPLRLWPLLPLYFGIQALVRRRAKTLALDLSGYTWERDDSSR